MKLIERIDGLSIRANTVPNENLRGQYADAVVEYLNWAWRLSQIDDIVPGASLGMVGSFARAEGGPRSDLDVVILLPKKIDVFPGGQEAIEQFVRLLWDSGMGVDHSVRTIAECSEIAGKDLPALTGLLNLQHVSGDLGLTDEAAERILEDYRKAARKRAQELLVDTQLRWDQYDELDRLNEPDLKNSAGGLRDVDLLRALSTSWLTDFSHVDVPEAATIIMNARDALHKVTGRHSNRLLRVYQPDVAELLGYGGEGRETAMMRDLRKAGSTIEMAARRAMETARQTQKAWGPVGLARRVLRQSSPRQPSVGPSTAVSVGKRLLEVEEELGFRKENLAADPDAVLELAYWSASKKMPISAATLNDIGEANKKTNIPFEWSDTRVRWFLKLLASGEGLRNTWNQLDSVGVPAFWIPEWEQLRGRPQNAAFHQWTVDRHLIETVIRMQSILLGSEETILSVNEDAKSVALLAALLHDLGKQPPNGGVDHAIHGKELAGPVLERMGINIDEAKTILLLIENHLQLARLAIDEDPEEPTTVQAIIDICHGDISVLALLEALTCADSKGAGPKAWTAWRATLIRNFTEATADILTE